MPFRELFKNTSIFSKRSKIKQQSSYYFFHSLLKTSYRSPHVQFLAAPQLCLQVQYFSRNKEVVKMKSKIYSDCVKVYPIQTVLAFLRYHEICIPVSHSDRISSLHFVVVSLLNFVFRIHELFEKTVTEEHYS